WNSPNNARPARPLTHLQPHSSNDHLPSCVLAQKPGTFGKTQGLGRHASGARAPRQTDQRTTAKLFSVSTPPCWYASAIFKVEHASRQNILCRLQRKVEIGVESARSRGRVRYTWFA